MTTDQPELRPSAALSGQPFAPPRVGYLTMLDFFRVVACVTVVSQHSFIWTDMKVNVIGTGFITFLHFTRDAFFFLSALVICYAQVTRPRSLWGFWRRRYVQIGVPYVAWTAIYVVFTILRPGESWSHAGSLFGSDLLSGYYQLYVVVVLFQLYLVFPLLFKLLQSTRHHLLIMTVSLALALLLGIQLHFSPHLGPFSSATHWLGSEWPWSRDLLSYQEFFVAGALVAFHFDQVLDFVERRHRRIMMICTAVGAVTVLWYAISVALGSSISRASDIYQPIAVVWSIAAVTGLFCWSWSWENKAPRAQRSSARRFLPSISYLAGLSGGVYLCHVLFINFIRATLESLGLYGSIPWPATVALLFAGTLALSVPFVALILHTPLRWVLGGPVRSEQRARDNAALAYLQRPRPDAAAALAPSRSGSSTADRTDGIARFED
jgi:peptidoglycan/LPS O-acetylase OafA/YrhL